jgi:hypothetical protein
VKKLLSERDLKGRDLLLLSGLPERLALYHNKGPIMMGISRGIPDGLLPTRLPGNGLELLLSPLSGLCAVASR